MVLTAPPNTSPKTCRWCGRELPRTEFYAHDTNRDGLMGHCKTCHKTYSVARRRDRPDAAAKAREYRAKNKDRSRGYWQKSARKNAAKRAAYTAAWIKAHPEKKREYDGRRRVRLGRGESFTAAEWAACKWLFGGVCLRCGATENLSVDHVIPLCRGGDNAAGNLQPLCRRCNSKKRHNVWDFRPANLRAALARIDDRIAALEAAHEPTKG